MEIDIQDMSIQIKVGYDFDKNLQKHYIVFYLVCEEIGFNQIYYKSVSTLDSFEDSIDNAFTFLLNQFFNDLSLLVWSIEDYKKNFPDNHLNCLISFSIQENLYDILIDCINECFNDWIDEDKSRCFLDTNIFAINLPNKVSIYNVLNNSNEFINLINNKVLFNMDFISLSSCKNDDFLEIYESLQNRYSQYFHTCFDMLKNCNLETNCFNCKKHCYSKYIINKILDDEDIEYLKDYVLKKGDCILENNNDDNIDITENHMLN